MVRSFAVVVIVSLAAIALGRVRRRPRREADRLGRDHRRRASGWPAATRRPRPGVTNLERVVVWGALLAATLRYATPLIFGALGGLFSERSGVINIALEGMMLMGAFFGAWGADITGSWFLGLVIAVVVGRDLRRVARAVRGHVPRRPDRLRHRAEPARDRHHGLPVRRDLRRAQGTPDDLPAGARRAPADRVDPADRRRVRAAQPAGLAGAGGGARDVGGRLPHADRPAAALLGREPAARPRPPA